MHEQMTGYKRMRREHQAALLKLEDKCKMEMESHKQQLDKEYEALLQQFSRELERLQVKMRFLTKNTGPNGLPSGTPMFFFCLFESQAKHQQELERRAKQNAIGEKKLIKDIMSRHEIDRKTFDNVRKKEYKANKEKWKRELSQDDSTPKKQRDATLQYVHFYFFY